MDDVTARYDPLVKQIAELHSHDEALYALILATKIIVEEWDGNRGGGHLKIDLSLLTPPSEAYAETIGAYGEDEDGMFIEILLHNLGSQNAWGEWFRVDGEPIRRWPPPSLRSF